MEDITESIVEIFKEFEEKVKYIYVTEMNLDMYKRFPRAGVEGIVTGNLVRTCLDRIRECKCIQYPIVETSDFGLSPEKVLIPVTVYIMSEKELQEVFEKIIQIVTLKE